MTSMQRDPDAKDPLSARKQLLDTKQGIVIIEYLLSLMGSVHLWVCQLLVDQLSPSWLHIGII